jgi:hypothetical protein
VPDRAARTLLHVDALGRLARGRIEWLKGDLQSGPISSRSCAAARGRPRFLVDEGAACGIRRELGSAGETASVRRRAQAHSLPGRNECLDGSPQWRCGLIAHFCSPALKHIRRHGIGVLDALIACFAAPGETASAAFGGRSISHADGRQPWASGGRNRVDALLYCAIVLNLESNECGFRAAVKMFSHSIC